MAATHNLQKMAKLVGDFIVKHDGVWNHDQWEALCGEVAALGVQMDSSLQEHLGLLLEHLKSFYVCMPATAAAKPKAKPKAKAKAKPKAKAKTKAKAMVAPPKPPDATAP